MERIREFLILDLGFLKSGKRKAKSEIRPSAAPNPLCGGAVEGLKTKKEKLKP